MLDDIFGTKDSRKPGSYYCYRQYGRWFYTAGRTHLNAPIEISSRADIKRYLEDLYPHQRVPVSFDPPPKKFYPSDRNYPEQP